MILGVNNASWLIRVLVHAINVTHLSQFRFTLENNCNLLLLITYPNFVLLIEDMFDQRKQVFGSHLSRFRFNLPRIVHAINVTHLSQFRFTLENNCNLLLLITYPDFVLLIEDMFNQRKQVFGSHLLPNTEIFKDVT